MDELTCFKAYDIRGEIGITIDEGVAYRIGRAVAQHFNSKSILIGFDARQTSPSFAAAVSKGVRDTGSDVIEIGLAGTEEMYWAVSEFNCCAGISVTASHNPIGYNGMKIVKSGSRPLDDVDDFQVIKKLAETQSWTGGSRRGKIINKASAARSAYVERVLKFIDLEALKPLKIVVNSGNGAAGPTLDAIAEQLDRNNVPIQFVCINHVPDWSFPNGIPNPMLPENHAETALVVKQENADFGVAFDGDFDRCFLFDDCGVFVPVEYVVGLLSGIFLDREVGGKIVHDPRVVWNIQDIVSQKGGVAVQSKTGHAFVKQMMRSQKAVYGGEISAHHYFRDFSFCDSGMIPWIMIAELVSKSGRSLRSLVADRRAKFQSSGEVNFSVDSPDDAIARVLGAYSPRAISSDNTDGFSLVFSDWRFNLRRSNTESLVRLNIETRAGGSEPINSHLKAITELIEGGAV